MTCAWTPDEEVLTEEFKSLSEEKRERALLLATSSLQALTYNRVGTCPITIRPCPSPPLCGCEWLPRRITEGYMNGNLTCLCGRACSPLSEIDLPGPVGFIDSLRIDGVEQDLTNGEWRLDDGHLLVWQGAGASPVPSYQDLNKGDDQPGTWSVTYSQSYPVLADARMAVAYLAMEFAKAFQPRGKCQLPRGVTQVARQGVSFTINAGLFPNGLTNIDVTDQFILKWAPAGSPTQSAQVFDPRALRPRVVSAVPMRPVGSLPGESS